MLNFRRLHLFSKYNSTIIRVLGIYDKVISNFLTKFRNEFLNASENLDGSVDKKLIKNIKSV